MSEPTHTPAAQKRRERAEKIKAERASHHKPTPLPPAEPKGTPVHKPTRWGLLRTAKQLEYAARIMDSVGEGNQAQRLRLEASRTRRQAMRTRWW